ncbi:MAG: sugar ABC transporter permease [Clostridiales bacterium]|nr:sugar ABC transporter permease [Candidatus Blautia equi]
MKKKKTLSYAKYGYIFSLPFVITFCLFTLYPVVFTIIIGFTDFKGLGAKISTMHFLAEPFKNYSTILSNATFQKALSNTFLMWGMNFAPQILLALVLAAWFSGMLIKVKGQGFFKVVFYMPNIITAATVAVLFGSIFGYPMGPMNDILRSWFGRSEPYEFFRNPWIARGVVAFIQFWMWYGYTMIVLISGILGMNPEWFEAADIDGATGLQKFMYITLPNLRSILIYTLVTSLIGGLQMFDIPKLLVTQSGPDNATLTASVFIQNQAFAGSYLYTRASAASMILFVIICILSAIVFYLMQDKYEVAEKKQLKAAAKAAKKARKGAN